jgi:hypothetical protein
MRSRGIYIDRVQGGSELALILDCMINDYPDGTENLGDLCGAPGAKDWLEVLPFFEVQTTLLSWWIENSSGDPMEITNDAVADNNQHSRGVAQRTNTASDPTLVTVTTDMHRGNVGLAVIDAISPLDNSLTAKAQYSLFVDVNGEDGNPPNGRQLLVQGHFARLLAVSTHPA